MDKRSLITALAAVAAVAIVVATTQKRQGALSIVDIAPTVLKYFGVAVPADLDGKSLS